MFPLGRRARRCSLPRTGQAKRQPVGSIDGEYFGQDRATGDSRPDGQSAAQPMSLLRPRRQSRLLGWHVGEVIPMGVYTDAQMRAATFGTAESKDRNVAWRCG